MGAWRPDAAPLGSQNLADVRNAVPTPTSWTPQRSLVPVVDNAVDGPIQGLTAATRTAGELEVFLGANGRLLRQTSKGSQAEDLTRLAAGAQTRVLRLRMRFLVAKPATFDTMKANLTSMAGLAGITITYVDEASANLPDFVDIVGGALLSQPSPELTALYNATRDPTHLNDAFVYFVDTATSESGGTSRGFATSAFPACVVSSTASPWTLAHEVCHLLGLTHVSVADNLMLSNTGNITNLPPDLSAPQIATIQSSYLLSPIREPYSTFAGTRWRFAQYGSLLVGTNFDDPIQAIDLAAGGSFRNLAASAPRARYIAVVRDLLVVAYTDDPVDSVDAYRVRWHGFNGGLPDPTAWALNASTQADFQRLSDVGQVQGLTGGEFGTVVCESGVVRMSYGGPALFQFDTVERRIGTRVPNSVVQYRQATFFWSPAGWQAFDGQAVRPIGVEKIDRWFADDFSEATEHLMWSAVDLTHQHVLWLYAGRGAQGRPNRLLRYVVPMDEWSVSDIDAEAIGPGKTFALTMDDPIFADMDAYEGNLDDPALWLTVPQTVTVVDGRLSAFSGTPLPAQFETGEFEAASGRRAMLTKALVFHEGGDVGLSIGRRDRFDAPMSWSREHARQSDGWFRFREPGRTHRARVALSGNWQRAQGLELTAAPLGMR